MATQRKTSNDYAKELHKLELDKMALEKRIRARCKEMIEQNPDISLGIITYANAPISEVFTKDYLRSIEKHDMKTIFEIMEIIEKDLANKHPHKQTTIEFPKTQHEKLMDIAKSIQALNIPKTE